MKNKLVIIIAGALILIAVVLLVISKRNSNLVSNPNNNNNGGSQTYTGGVQNGGNGNVTTGRNGENNQGQNTVGTNFNGEIPAAIIKDPTQPYAINNPRSNEPPQPVNNGNTGNNGNQTDNGSSAFVNQNQGNTSFDNNSTGENLVYVDGRPEYIQQIYDPWNVDTSSEKTDAQAIDSLDPNYPVTIADGFPSDTGGDTIVGDGVDEISTESLNEPDTVTDQGDAQQNSDPCQSQYISDSYPIFDALKYDPASKSYYNYYESSNNFDASVNQALQDIAEKQGYQDCSANGKLDNAAQTLTSYDIPLWPGFNESILHISNDNSLDALQTYINQMSDETKKYDLIHDYEILPRLMKSTSWKWDLQEGVRIELRKKALLAIPVPSQVKGFSEYYYHLYDQYSNIAKWKYKADREHNKQNVGGDYTALQDEVEKYQEVSDQIRKNIDTMRLRINYLKNHPEGLPGSGSTATANTPSGTQATGTSAAPTGSTSPAGTTSAGTSSGTADTGGQPSAGGGFGGGGGGTEFIPRE